MTSLAVKGNTIAVGDAISSVSILEVVQGSLRTVARDYGPVWPMAIETTRDGGVIVGNVRTLAILLAYRPTLITTIDR